MKTKIIYCVLLFLLITFNNSGFAQCLETNLGQELVVNGDFEMGDTCFTTQYTYHSATPGVGGSFPMSGEYAVEKDPSVYLTSGTTGMWFSLWGGGDHTFGMPCVGKYLFFNGDTSTYKVIWEQQVNVEIGKDYIFGCWVNNIIMPPYNRTDPMMELLIDGAVHVPTTLIDELPDTWIWLCNTYKATKTGLITLTIKTESTVLSGNDGGIDDVTFREYSTSSIDNPLYINKLNIYPNPSAGIFTISITGINETTNLSITNLQGQEVYKENLNVTSNYTKQLDISNYPKGIYFLKLMNEDVVKVEKVVVQ